MRLLPPYITQTRPVLQDVRRVEGEVSSAPVRRLEGPSAWTKLILKQGGDSMVRRQDPPSFTRWSSYWGGQDGGVLAENELEQPRATPGGSECGYVTSPCSRAQSGETCVP